MQSHAMIVCDILCIILHASITDCPSWLCTVPIPLHAHLLHRPTCPKISYRLDLTGFVCAELDLNIPRFGLQRMGSTRFLVSIFNYLTCMAFPQLDMTERSISQSIKSQVSAIWHRQTSKGNGYAARSSPACLGIFTISSAMHDPHYWLFISRSRT